MPVNAKLSNMATRFRPAGWLQKNEFGPQVFIFRNIESGQVIYSQTPKITDYQITKQFQRPNWENRKPKLRRDIWRIMAVVTTSNYESAVGIYESLVQLRSMRDLTLKKVAMKFRPRNKDGNIWCSAQFRPIYSQEAVSDLSSSIDHIQDNVTILWEDSWRKGDLKNWNENLVKHETLDRASLETPKSLLEELRVKARNEFLKLRLEEEKISNQLNGVHLTENPIPEGETSKRT